MSVRKVFTEVVPEKSTSFYGGVIKDEKGVAIPGSTLTSLQAWLYLLDPSSKTIINAVSGVNILNTGRGSVDGNGNIGVTLTPEDNAILTPGLQTPEPHLLLLKWTWPTSKWGFRQVQMPIGDQDYVS